MKRQLIKLAILLLFIGGLAYFVAVSLGASNHACCSVAAQDEGEGNPGHVEPTKQCAHNPTAKQVGCKCVRACDSEDRRCKSWCFPKWCWCPSKPCP